MLRQLNNMEMEMVSGGHCPAEDHEPCDHSPFATHGDPPPSATTDYVPPTEGTYEEAPEDPDSR